MTLTAAHRPREESHGHREYAASPTCPTSIPSGAWGWKVRPDLCMQLRAEGDAGASRWRVARFRTSFTCHVALGGSLASLGLSFLRECLGWPHRQVSKPESLRGGCLWRQGL